MVKRVREYEWASAESTLCCQFRKGVFQFYPTTERTPFTHPNGHFGYFPYHDNDDITISPDRTDQDGIPSVSDFPEDSWFHKMGVTGWKGVSNSQLADIMRHYQKIERLFYTLRENQVGTLQESLKNGSPVWETYKALFNWHDDWGAFNKQITYDDLKDCYLAHTNWAEYIHIQLQSLYPHSNRTEALESSLQCLFESLLMQNFIVIKNHHDERVIQKLMKLSPVSVWMLNVIQLLLAGQAAAGWLTKVEEEAIFQPRMKDFPTVPHKRKPQPDDY